MKLYFTRHGESEANTRRIISNRDLPYPLTETGRQQALALAHRLDGKSITRIYSSPIPRARETAEIVSNLLGAPLECTQALREPDCGSLEGRGDIMAWAEHDFWKAAWLAGRALEHGPRGGETCMEVRKRLAEFVEALVDRYGASESEFLLVTHGALILFGLPHVVSGVEAHNLLEHGIEHTALICAEYQVDQLVYMGIV